MNHGERVIYRAVYDSPIGLLTLTALDDALGALSFPRERYPKDAELLKAGKEVCIPQKDRLPAVLRDTFRWLDIYFQEKYRILCRLLCRREASLDGWSGISCLRSLMVVRLRMVSWRRQ